MQEKELRKMSRMELIEIIYALQQNEKGLRAENEDLKKRLEDKSIKIEKAGSIAEAAVALNSIFEDAERAAEQYISSVREMQEENRLKAEQILEGARVRAEEMIREAEKRIKN
ncbi:MAG: hypothetical protein LUG52_01840 [Clostridia bacterium]|nr:hypothetical protein [Clostridia bacterium]